MAGKLGVDCTSGVINESSISDLLATFGIALSAEQARRDSLHAASRVDGKSNRRAITDIEIQPHFTDIEIFGIILDEVTQPSMDGTRGSALYKVPFRLNQCPEHEWKQLFLQSWQYPPRFSV